MNLFLLDGSIISATIDVGFLFVGAMALTSLFWYFGWHKKDRDTIDTLKKSLDKVQPQHDVLQNQHEHLKSEHIKVKQGLSDLMENYQLLNTKHEDYIANQSSKKNLYDQVDEERQSLLDSYESLENNFNALDIKYNDAETTLDRLEEEIENIKDEKNELLLDNNHLRKKILKLQNSSNAPDGNNLVDSADFEEGSTAEDDEIEKLIGAAKGQQFSSSNNIIAFSTEAAEGSQTGAALLAELESLKADYHQLQVENQSLVKQFEALKNTHDELIESNQKLKEQKRNDSSENSLSQLQDEHSSLQDDYVTLTMELNNKVLPQLRATQSLLNKKEEKYRNLMAKMDAQTAKYQNSSNQLKSFEGVRATSQALYTRNKSLTEKNTELERKYEKLSGEYSGLHSQFRILRDQFGLVESKLETSENNATNNSELAQLSKEYSNLKIEYLATADQLKVQQDRIKDLEVLLNSINESSSYGIIYLPSNLQVIEGIEPKIEPILNQAGIQNWSDLAITDLSTLQTIIKEAGKRYEITTDPTSWTEQAQLLATGKWKEFRDLEASLIAGKKVKSKTQEFDDLKVIEGIGPKIEVLLNNSKIYTWKKLSKTGIGELKRILKAAGSKYQIHDPSTWPEQAALAATWNWTELEALQEELKGGRAQA